MDKKTAEKIQAHMLAIFSEFSAALLAATEGKCNEDEFERLKRAIGENIGQVQVGILDPIYKTHPDLDDLT